MRLLTGPEAKIATYRGHGPLGAWVRVCAVRLALELKESAERRCDDEAGLLDNLVSREANPELLAVKAQHRDTFRAALEEGFAGLALREKTLLRMHFLDDMGIDEIGIVFHVHRATVARWLVAIRRRLLQQLCSKVALDLRASSSEFVSLMRLVRSDVQISLQRLLTSDEEAARAQGERGPR